MGINITPQVLEVIKLAALVFALIHFLAGVILVQQMYRMNKTVRTTNQGCFNLINILYVFMLLLVLILLIIF